MALPINSKFDGMIAESRMTCITTCPARPLCEVVVGRKKSG